MTCYTQNDEGEKAVKCFNQMRREGLKPNEFTISSTLSGCSNLTMLETGRQLHTLLVKSGFSSHLYVASSLIDIYGKCRCIEEAEAVFMGMASRNTVSWNTMICEYSQHGQGKKALEAFRLMLDEGVTPDEIAFVGVLSACSHMGLIEEGKKHFNSLSEVHEITPSVEHCACMVNMLCREGKFDEIERFIQERGLSQNSLIWGTILWACKMHGNVKFGEKAAERLFQLAPKVDYNYILLSDIFASIGKWDDVMKVRAMMLSRGIKKQPRCSWVEVDAQAHVFFAQDSSHPHTKEESLQLGKLARNSANWGTA